MCVGVVVCLICTNTNPEQTAPKPRNARPEGESEFNGMCITQLWLLVLIQCSPYTNIGTSCFPYSCLCQAPPQWQNFK